MENVLNNRNIFKYDEINKKLQIKMFIFSDYVKIT